MCRDHIKNSFQIADKYEFNNVTYLESDFWCDYVIQEVLFNFSQQIFLLFFDEYFGGISGF